MKKIIILSITLIFVGSGVFATMIPSNLSTSDPNQPEETATTVQKSANQAQNQAQIQGQAEVEEESEGEEKEELIILPSQTKLKAQSVNELKDIIEEKKEEFKTEIQAIKDEYKQKVYQNQNAVREAVHSLLAMEDLVGGIGKEVSEIAKDFNNSVQKTIEAEEKIQKRNRFVKFFFGGDQEAVEELEEQTNKNQERIEKLKELKKQCSECTEEIKNIIEEKVQNVEQEQQRLRELGEKEKNNRGIFGWFRNLFSWWK